MNATFVQSSGSFLTRLGAFVRCSSFARISQSSKALCLIATRTTPTRGASRQMSAALQDEADPIYSHFGHRSEFLELLSDFLEVDVASQPSKGQDEREREIVRALGAIVRAVLSCCAGVRAVDSCNGIPGKRPLRFTRIDYG
jgi:hypothetical protein